jgi:hypothetical protein
MGLFGLLVAGPSVPGFYCWVPILASIETIANRPDLDAARF